MQIQLGQMSQKHLRPQQKRMIALVLFVIFALFISYDVYHLLTPNTETTPSINMEIVEAFILLLGGSAFMYLWYLTKNEERNQIRYESEINQMKAERDEWKQKSSELIVEFQDYILRHFDYWKLTNSEKEVGLFLLKGLSSKEIAVIRNVSERTIRNQAMSIYSKSGLSGKHELAAYFLEELLLPKTPQA